VDARQWSAACNKEGRDDTTDKKENQNNYLIESADRGNLDIVVGRIPGCDTR